MGHIKRAPQIQNHRRYTRISKASLAEAYIDLYRQVFGETTDEDDIFTDMEARIELLANYRKQWAKEDAQAAPTETPAAPEKPAVAPAPAAVSNFGTVFKLGKLYCAQWFDGTRFLSERVPTRKEANDVLRAKGIEVLSKADYQEPSRIASQYVYDQRKAQQSK